MHLKFLSCNQACACYIAHSSQASLLDSQTLSMSAGFAGHKMLRVSLVWRRCTMRSGCRHTTEELSWPAAVAGRLPLPRSLLWRRLECR